MRSLLLATMIALVAAVSAAEPPGTTDGYRLVSADEFDEARQFAALDPQRIFAAVAEFYGLDKSALSRRHGGSRRLEDLREAVRSIPQ